MAIFYGYDDMKFACIDAETGESEWVTRTVGGQVILVEDVGALIILSEDGEVILVEATPDGYEPLHTINALSSKTWNHPVVAQGKLLVRNDREAVCYDLPITE